MNPVRIIPIILIAMAVAIWGCTNHKTPPSQMFDPGMESEINQVVASGELPSVQVAVIDQNQIVLSKTFGASSSPDALYMNGSVQKVFDAAAILQLHERGLVDLDEDISVYLPFKINHPEYPDKPVTIRMMLSHRSGLDAFEDQFSWDTECLFSPEYRPACNTDLLTLSLEEYLTASFSPQGSLYNPDAWQGKPGEDYHYSVSAYPLLRFLIEEVSGTTYPDYMEENIFTPLGMHHSGFSADDHVGQHATPSTRINGADIVLPVWNGNGYMMRSTAEDMAAFMLALINDGTLNGTQILQPGTIELMRTKSTHGRSILNPKSELTDHGYGLGLIHYNHGWMGHGGSTVGYQTLLEFNPSKQCGFIIITNVNGILGGYEDFQSVWKHMAAIEDILLSALDPIAALDIDPIVVALILAAVISFSNIFVRWVKRKNNK